MSTADNELTTLFAFERDFEPSLPCLPMAVRFKLDACGIKLSLKEWNKLSDASRRELLDRGVGSAQELNTFAQRTDAMVMPLLGRAPERFPAPASPAWRAEAGVPEDVATKAAEEGIALDAAAWARLSDLQRFALLKLSRPRHKNENFAHAAREFGLLPR